MPARGRELHDVRQALQRLLKRYPDGRRRALDDDLRSVLEHADAIVKATEPAGRGDDGEPSPGERATESARRGDPFAAVADDLGASSINRDRSPGSRAGGVGLTPGQQAAQRGSDGYRIGRVGSEKGKRRGSRDVVTLRDV